MKNPKKLNHEDKAGIIVGVLVEMKERNEDPINIGYTISLVLESIEGVEY